MPSLNKQIKKSTVNMQDKNDFHCTKKRKDQRPVQGIQEALQQLFTADSDCIKKITHFQSSNTACSDQTSMAPKQHIFKKMEQYLRHHMI